MRAFNGCWFIATFSFITHIEAIKTFILLKKYPRASLSYLPSKYVNVQGDVITFPFRFSFVKLAALGKLGNRDFLAVMSHGGALYKFSLDCSSNFMLRSPLLHHSLRDTQQSSAQKLHSPWNHVKVKRKWNTLVFISNLPLAAANFHRDRRALHVENHVLTRQKIARYQKWARVESELYLIAPERGVNGEPNNTFKSIRWLSMGRWKSHGFSRLHEAFQVYCSICNSGAQATT